MMKLLVAWLGEDDYTKAREAYPRKVLSSDDILDAFAGLWTAERIYKGEAKTLPENPPVDPMGLRMEMVYRAGNGLGSAVKCFL